MGNASGLGGARNFSFWARDPLSHFAGRGWQRGCKAGGEAPSADLWGLARGVKAKAQPWPQLPCEWPGYQSETRLTLAVGSEWVNVHTGVRTVAGTSAGS